MWRTSTQNKGRYGIPGDGPSGPFFTPEACPDESRTNKRCARRVPPLSGRIWCGGAKAALGFAPPPPGARLRWPGTPAPGQHQPHLIFGGQAWPPLARPPRCFFGGRCGGLLAVVGQDPAPYIVGGGARGGPPGGRWLQRYRLDQVCALVESACLRPRRRGGCPCPGFNAPPAPPEGGDGGSITVRKGV